MPVTELSRLTLKKELKEEPKTVVIRALSRAKKLMEDFTGHDFHLYQEIENANHIYILGQWESVEQHMNEWIPSEANQGLLKDLVSFVEVDYLFHLDVSFGSIPPSEQAPIFSVGRHVMESEKRAAFESTFNKRRGGLEAHAPGTISGGWRIEKEHGREEFVLFVPWKDVDQHMAFKMTKEFEEYAEIRDHILLDATEIRHVALMEFPSPATQDDAA
ncbi:uncharacterized protein N0V89_005099 [Didymosphaeria variabile]|uniref:ABM domain-containing protein n=1 Tax=Didymosphaeria variabile TaxID=1932322 RepID=A0A9W8XMJ2_9PLEO|nr:uncharacterized protein N0V89_005099 [Didymosphaeria variabile]KAJ4353370.1 hypothetical protein N0V89_005099 [Didymosphaeria variabile]